MSWVPPNLAATCTFQSTITTCQPSTYVFLQLLSTLFGQSPDTSIQKDDIGNRFGGTKHNYGYGIYGSEANVVNEDSFSEFDFIVIGAGTAGCLVANRLSKVPEWNVLLLEAGEEEPDVASVPSFAPTLRSSSLDWRFRTQPEPQCCTQRPQGRCTWPRGKVMGGTSVINYMIYLRGHPKDFDDWAEMGNPGWSYKEVLPYFLKTERNANPDKVGTKYHGVSGDWPVEYFPVQDDNEFYLLEAFKELGLDLFDQNGERQVGASLIQHSTRDGMRVSANVAFIRPIRNVRKNLVVQSRAFVIRVLINPHTKVAYGVEYSKNGQIYRAFARKEVIVSSGVIGSPKVLMLSGVGPADHLAELNIDVIHNLKVGYNLHDHTTIDGIVMALSNTSSTSVSEEQQTSDIYEYRRTRRGPLSGTGTLQVNSYIQTIYEKDFDRPDMQYSLDAINVRDFYNDPILTGLTNVLPLSYYNGITIRPVLLAPESRGVLKLNYTHPVFGDPLIYANTFGDPIDLLKMVDGIKQSLPLLQTKIMQEIGASLVSTPLPPCEPYVFGTDEYWACLSTAYTSTLYHPVGTCKMAPFSDPHAVVNYELKVHGIHGLRVIDASIMPVVVRANTNTATLMIAEKGCDMIKNDWLKRKQSSWTPKHSVEGSQERSQEREWLTKSEMLKKSSTVQRQNLGKNLGQNPPWLDRFVDKLKLNLKQ